MSDVDKVYCQSTMIPHSTFLLGFNNLDKDKKLIVYPKTLLSFMSCPIKNVFALQGLTGENSSDS